MQDCVANLLTHNKQQISDNCINLRNFFPELFQRWQQDSRQADAAEFASLLLETAKQSCVNQSWEQRLLVNNDTGFQITVHDHGEAWVPLNLAPSHESSEAIELADLFPIWSDYLGMTTALLAPTSLLCCQFERLNAADSRRANPLLFNDPCQVPIFCGNDIDLDWLEYKPFALISHAGSAHSGHYQMAFQVGAGRESLWLLLDDKCIFPLEAHVLTPGAVGNADEAALLNPPRVPLRGTKTNPPPGGSFWEVSTISPKINEAKEMNIHEAAPFAAA